jgi:hypothetical protein
VTVTAHLHPRHQIREAVVAQLLGATAAEERVFPTRFVPWKKLALPGIAVYALEETVEAVRTLPRELVRSLRIEVLAVVSGTEQVDDAVDALALEIETALHADPSFGGTAEDSLLSSTQIGTDEDQGRPLGAARLVYDVRYYTPAAPE